MTERLQPVAHYPVQLQGSALARSVLALLGWRVDFLGLPERQGVIVVYPHTSNWDFVIALLAKWSVGLQLKFWAKDTLFKVPIFGSWLAWVGGVPVMRHAPGGTVGQFTDALQASKSEDRFFWLGLSPEGTRKWVSGWRSGFYQAARGARVPVGLARLDYAQKRLVLTTFVDLSGDPAQDMRTIASVLGGAVGKNAEQASPIEWIKKP